MQPDPNDPDGSLHDNLWRDAVRLVIENGKASTSLLQRRLRIGYGRSARLIEEMEERGIIGAADGSRPREVLVQSMDEVTGLNGPAMNATPPEPKVVKTDDEIITDFVTALESNDEFNQLLDRYKSWIKTFYDIAERKVAILDEYGDEDWDALYKEISTLLYKVYRQELSEGRNIGWFDVDTYLLIGSPMARLKTMSRNGGRMVANLGIYLEVKFKQKYATDNEAVGKRSIYMSFDNLTGREFEGFVAKLLKELGYTDISGTPVTGDQGADIIAKKNGRIVLIQAKRYHKPVGNSAVQEIVGALKFYNGNDGWVITNSTFTPGAKALAQRNNIRLTDGQELATLMTEKRKTSSDKLVQG